MFLTTFIQVRETMRDFCRKEQGVTAIEYALVGVAVAVIVGVVFGTDGSLKSALDTGMENIEAAMAPAAEE